MLLSLSHCCCCLCAISQAASSGKPAAVIAKMVEGRLGKWYEEACLLEQKFVLDDSVTVKKVRGGKQALSA